MTDGVDHYRAALLAFGDTVRRVGPQRWDHPSPCPGWTVRHVVEHVAGAQRTLLGLLGLEPGDPGATWDDVENRVLAALDDPDLPRRRITTPMGELDGSALLDMGVVEPLVHRWDLATALGEHADLDEETAARCLRIARQYEPALRGPGMYGPAQDARPGAGAGEALLAFLGRAPAGTPGQGR